MAKYYGLCASLLVASTWAAPTCLTNGSNSRSIVNSGQWQVQQFQTVPYTPPVFQINSTSSALASGYIFIGPLNSKASGLKQNGPVIMTDTGDLVWNGPQKLRAYNFVTQQYNGSAVLSYWSGVYSTGENLGHGFGSVTILDDEYQEITTLCPDLGLNQVQSDPRTIKCGFDLHESYITDRGTLLATAYNVRQANLTAIGGPANGYVFSGMVFEVDIATQNILFRWDSIDHVPVTATYIKVGVHGTADSPLDYFHINSIQLVGDNYLVNSRQTWSTYLISPNGDVLWKLDGSTGGDFGALPAAANFHWAHHVRAISQTSNSMTITIFNNDNGSPVVSEGPSAGLTLQLPMPPNSSAVQLVSRVTHTPPVYAAAEGSITTPLANNSNQFVGFGDFPIMAEFSAAGSQLWSAQFGPYNSSESYRAFKQLWQSTPKAAPKLVVKAATKGCKTAYVSWNGATDVDSWYVYTGPSSKKLTRVGVVVNAGFETSFGVGGKCVQVMAVRQGSAVRRSNVECSGS